MHQVAILAYPNLAMFELGCAIELFALPRPEQSDWYECQVISFEQGALPATAGVTVNVNYLQSLAGFQTLVIPGWSAEKKEIPPLLAQEIISFYQRGGRILSLCSGAFLLAELGLLDHQQATTHWRYADTFQKRFPHIEFAHNVLYLLNDRIGCSAGSAAGIDLGLEVIRQDFGYRAANQVARRLVLPPHRQGGQAQFVDTPVIEHHPLLSDTLDWARSQLAEPLDIEQLAQHALMSRRSFDRHFRKSMGMSPQKWLHQQRIAHAQNYLEQGSKGIDWIADKTGFGSAMNMRHHFKQQLGISPQQYRLQFCNPETS